MNEAMLGMLVVIVLIEGVLLWDAEHPHKLQAIPVPVCTIVVPNTVQEYR